MGGPTPEPLTTSEARLNSSRTDYNFNPRLYPGSARYAASQNTFNGQNGRACVPFRRDSTSSVATAPEVHPSTFNSLNSSYESAFRQPPPSLISLPLPFSPPERQNSAVRIISPERQNSAIRITGPRLIAAEENKSEEQPYGDSDYTQSERAVEQDSPQKVSLDEDLALLSTVSTPRFVADAQLQEFIVKPGHQNGDTSLPSPSDFSTDFSTISSASSSVLHASSPAPSMKRKRGPSVSYIPWPVYGSILTSATLHSARGQERPLRLALTYPP